MIRLVIIAFVSCFSALAAITISPLAAVDACSLVRFEDRQERLRFSASVADLIFVGMVTRENRVGPDNSSRNYGEGIYDSTVQPIAVLHGEAPDSPIRLAGLNDIDNDCLSAARLPEGGPYLLFLGWRHSGYLRGEPIDFHWSMMPLGGKIILDSDGNASFDELANTASGPLGSSEDVIRTVARIRGSSEREVRAALAAAGRPVPARDSTDDLIISGALVALLGVGFMLRGGVRAGLR
jgi:hypothetical protein